MKELEKGFSQKVVFAHDYMENLEELMSNAGRTDRFSTGISGLDEYLYGGYGRKDKWDIIVLHASYGVGKSTFAIQMLVEPIKAGVPVGIMALEDDPEDVMIRLNVALGGTATEPSKYLMKNIRFMPQESLERLWTFDELLEEIRKWLTDPIHGVDILMLDHLQFAFDSAALGEEKDQWRAQSSFMFRLNAMMKKLKNKTLILISQQNKQREIAGSISTPRVATKMISMARVEKHDGRRLIQMEKSRGTPDRSYPYIVEITAQGIQDSPDQVGDIEDLF